jgi:hypothetical protein
LAEKVSGPLNTVKSLFREHFESAMWNFVVILRVFLRSVAFSEEGEDNLDMTFRSKSPTFYKWSLGSHTSLVHILPGSHIVKSISNY